MVKTSASTAGVMDSIPGLGTKILHASQFSSVTQSCLTFCNPMDSSTPGFPVHHQPPEPPQTHVHWVGDAIYLILCHPLLLLPSIFLSIRVFSSELALHIRCPKYWSFSFSTSPFNEFSGLISFRINWFDFAVQGTPRVFSNTTVKKHQFFGTQFLYDSTLTPIYDYWKNQSFD